MTNLELAGKLQASSARNDDLVGLLWDAGAALRNLHTENTALRVTEDNLRQELQECQDQRRAAFRRIEELDRELDAMRAQIGQGVPDGWQLVPKEPTDAMVRAALHLDLSYMPGHAGPDRAAVYEAMLASAPPAPQQKPLTDEPDWRHPKIQGLIGSEARLRIAIDLIWQILENPEQEFTASDMEYWDTIHDKLKESLSVTRAIEAAHNIGEKK